MARRTLLVPLALLVAILVALQTPLAPAAVPALPAEDSCAADGDASDVSSAPEPLESPAVCSGTVTVLDAADHYGFEATAGKRVDIALSASEDAYQACAFGPEMTGWGCRTVTGSSRLVFTALDSGPHRLSILRGASATAGYGFALAVAEPPAQDDCGSGRDAGDVARAPLAATLPIVCEGAFVDAYDTHDWYAFDVVGSASLRLAVSSTSGAGASACLVRPSGAIGPCTSSTALVINPEPGIWKLSLRPTPAGQAGGYALAVEVLPASAQDDCGSGRDAGLDAATAVRLTLPADCSGLMGMPYDSGDGYLIHAEAGELLDVALSTSTPRSLCLRGPEGIVQCDWGSGAISHLVRDAGDHLLTVFAGSAGNASYALTVRATVPSAPGQADCGAAGDAGNLARWARAFSAASCEGALGTLHEDPEDWYLLEGHLGHAMTLRLAMLGGDADLCVYEPDGRTVLACSQKPGEEDDVVTFTSDGPGPHLVQVRPYAGAPSYALTLTVAATQDDCGSGRDAGRLAGAVRLEGPTTRCRGALPAEERDTADAYVVRVEQGQTLAASLAGTPLFDFDLCLYAPDATTPTACSASRSPTVERLVHPAEVAGDWRVVVTRMNGTGAYDLVVAVS